MDSFDPNKPLVINCGEIEGFKDLTGKFVFKRPNNRDKITIAVKNAKMTENAELSTVFSNLAWVISTLEVVLVEKPKDLDLQNIYDMEPVFDLYDRYSQWVNSFRPVVQATETATV